MNPAPARTPRLLVPLVVLATAAPLLLAASSPAGALPGGTTEQRVNTTTQGAQLQPAVAVDADGDHVVVWTSVGQDGDAGGIYSQRYGSNGVARGSEIRVNTTTAGIQGEAAVAMDARGDYVVVWTSLQDGSGFGIYAQHYDASGVPQGAETRVNITTEGDQSLPAVAMDADGDYVVAWTSAGQDGDLSGIFSRRFGAGGIPLGGETWVNTATGGHQTQPAIAMDADGDHVVAWQSFGQDGGGYGIYAQRFNGIGEPQGPETRVNTTTASEQQLPAAAMDADGDYVIAWQSLAQDGAGFGIFAQHFNAGGAPQGPETRVNTTTASEQQAPSVAMDADGDHVVAWQSHAQDGLDFGTYTQRYDAAGDPVRGETRVNMYTASNQADPVVAADADGDAVFAWRSDGQDGSVSGVYARRARGPATVDLRVVQADDADPVGVGGRLVYRLRVFNRTAPVEDTGVPEIDAAIGSASGVRLVTTPPDGATLRSATGAGWVCGAPGATLGCRLAPTVPAGGVSSVLVLTYTAPTAAGAVLHLAQVSDRHLDPAPSDDVDVERTDVRCVIELDASAYARTEAGRLTATVVRHGTGCGESGVSFATRPGSAVPGEDYTSSAGSLSWSASDTSLDVVVPLVDDALDENPEHLEVVLSGPSGALLGRRAVAVGEILDNDDPPRVNLTATAGAAAEPGALVDVGVRLSEISGRAVTVTLGRAGTATHADDYFAPRQLMIPAGQRTAEFTVEVVDDALTEGVERAVISLVAPAGATVGTQRTYRLTIADDD